MAIHRAVVQYPVLSFLLLLVCKEFLRMGQPLCRFHQVDVGSDPDRIRQNIGIRLFLRPAVPIGLNDLDHLLRVIPDPPLPEPFRTFFQVHKIFQQDGNAFCGPFYGWFRDPDVRPGQWGVVFPGIS